MTLTTANLISFIPSQNLQLAQAFYSQALELKLLRADDYGLEYQCANGLLRITRVNDTTQAEYTIAGWVVADIESAVKELSDNGINFIQYPGMPQNEAGICSFESGSQVAWFRDPDGNTLSLTQHPDNS